MKIVVLHGFADYRGDHSRDCEVPIDLSPDTTLQEAAEKLLARNLKATAHRGTEYIVIKPVLASPEEGGE